MKKITIKSKALVINKVQNKFLGQIKNHNIEELKLSEILVKFPLLALMPISDSL